MKLKIVLLASILLSCASASKAADTDITIDQSIPNVAKSTQVQRFADYIDLKPGQEKLPLTLTFRNGGDKGPPFAWLRISIAGKPLYTEKDFKGDNVFSTPMTGEIGAGSSQILIQGAGPVGAILTWQLTAPTVTLSSVKPDKLPAGAKLTLNGNSFSSNPNGNVVSFEGKNGQVVSATDTVLVVTVPNDAKAGKNKVTVTVAGVTSQAKEITVLQKPQVTATDMVNAPPGTPIKIAGKNFSPVASENKVTIGGYAADVIDASENSLTVTVPMAMDEVNPSWEHKVVVEVNGVKSNDDVTFDLDQRLIPSGEYLEPPSR